MLVSESIRRRRVVTWCKGMQALAALGWAAVAQATPAYAYQFKELTVDPAYSYVSVSGINNVGQAVGTVAADFLVDVPVVWTATGYEVGSGRYDAGRYNHGVAINDAGAVIANGFTDNPQFDGRAVYWNNSLYKALDGPYKDVPTSGPYQGLPTDAQGINNAGQIVGSTQGPYDTQAVIWQSHDATATVLPALPGVAVWVSSAKGINSAGVAVGYSQVLTDIGFHDEATVWTNGGASALESLDGHDSVAVGINDAGQVIGYSGNRSVLWTNGVISALDRLPGANGEELKDINDLGQVVGLSTLGVNGPNVATLWDGKSVIDLNQYVAGSGWVLQDAVGINNQGWIVGNALDTLTGNSRPYMLIPEVPEPGTLALWGLGAVALAFGVGRRRTPPAHL